MYVRYILYQTEEERTARCNGAFDHIALNMIA